MTAIVIGFPAVFAPFSSSGEPTIAVPGSSAFSMSSTVQDAWTKDDYELVERICPSEDQLWAQLGSWDM